MLDRIQDRPTLDYIVNVARRSALTGVIEDHAKLKQKVVRCSAMYPGYDFEVTFYVMIGSDGHYVRLMGEIDIGRQGYLRLANEWNNSVKPIGPSIPMSDGYALTYCVTFGQGMVGMNFAQTLLMFGEVMSEFRTFAVESHQRFVEEAEPEPGTHTTSLTRL